MNVKICSRKEAERLLNHGFPADTAVISFYDSDSAPRVDYQKKADSVLYVPLDDFQTELPKAREIAKFIRTAKAKGLNIICQCESGQNRSAGCAAAIMEYYHHTGQSVFDNDRYHPDDMIYYALFDALEIIM